MLTTENTKFKVNRDGTLYVEASRSVCIEELAKVLRMAVMHARRKKIKKPTEWNIIWNMSKAA